MSAPSRDARAVVEAVDRLTTQVRRLADAQSTPVTVADDAPTTTAQRPVVGIDPGTEPRMVVAHWLPMSEQQAEEMNEASSLIQQWAAGAVTAARAADEDALRTARRDSIRNLLNRLDRYVAWTPAETELLRQHVEREIRDADTARAVAAGNKRHVQLLAPELDDLQARITKARALHASHANGSAECTQRCERAHPEVRVCNGCGWTAPCPTARALDGTEQPTGCPCHTSDERCSGCGRCPDVCHGCDGNDQPTTKEN